MVSLCTIYVVISNISNIKMYSAYIYFTIFITIYEFVAVYVFISFVIKQIAAKIRNFSLLENCFIK